MFNWLVHQQPRGCCCSTAAEYDVRPAAAAAPSAAGMLLCPAAASRCVDAVKHTHECYVLCYLAYATQPRSGSPNQEPTKRLKGAGNIEEQLMIVQNIYWEQ